MNEAEVKDSNAKIDSFAKASARVCTLRDIWHCVRIGRPNKADMASWGFTEEEFRAAARLALSYSLAGTGEIAW